jgi:hypothetical protein
LKRRDYPAALENASAGLRIDPSDASLQAALDTILRTAETAARTARRSASNASTTRSFKEAVEIDQRARDESRRGLKEQATRSFWRATELFRTSETELRAENRAEEPPSATVPPPVAAETGVVATAPERPTVENPPPRNDDTPTSKPDPPKEATPPAPTGAALVAREHEAIRDTLGQWGSAMEARNISSVRRLEPNVDERQLRRAFDDLESQTVTFEDVQIALGANQRTATVRATVRRVINPKAGRTFNAPARVETFQLEKQGDVWRIVARK